MRWLTTLKPGGKERLASVDQFSASQSERSFQDYMGDSRHEDHLKKLAQGRTCPRLVLGAA